MEIVEFIRQQLDEDERVALAASGDPPRPGGDIWDLHNGRSRGLIRIGDHNVLVYGEGKPSSEQAEHIALHDPARVLREVEAKRRILDRHERTSDEALAAGREMYPDPDWSPMCRNCEVTWPCGDVLDMASVFADRPGYREEWRP